MDGIFCNECGAKVEESPTLLPEQRSPCPTCGSLSRRFEQTIGNNFFRLPGEQPAKVTFIRPVGIEPGAAVGNATVAHAEPAIGTGTAYDAEVQVTEEPRSGQAIGEQRVTGRSTGARGPRRINDHLVVMGRSLWWTQLTEEPTWMVQVVDEAGELIATGIGDDQIDALVGVAESLLPGHPG